MTAATPTAGPTRTGPAPARDGAGLDHVEVRRGVYHDSVTLLRMSSAVGGVDGVQAAQIAMATPFNLEFATGAGFAVPGTAGPNDLLIAVRGADPMAIEAALAAFEALLAAADHATRAPGGLGGAPAPRSVRAAAGAAPDAALVLISVPGPYVLGEAMDAIAAGRHVMIFSDNVPVEHEIVLKRAAADRGVLVMGPDCGTAMVGGVGLGFANVLADTGAAPGAGTGRRGDPDDGPGAQQLTCLLDDAGVAVSAVLGLGGRDLSAAVGGRSALTALSMLDDDPGTDHIVLISKPADPATADAVLAAAGAARTPFTAMVLGGSGDITSGVERLLTSIGVPTPEWRRWGDPSAAPAATGHLRGLFAGGTLADEAMLVLADRLGDIASNIPLRPELALPAAAGTSGLPQLAGLGSVVLDLGDDQFTSGRPHPMIDPTVRLQLLAAQAADPEVSVLLLDVVLGHGAEADPAAKLAPAIASALRHRPVGAMPLQVVVSLCGTSGDPQDRERQAAALVGAGATVYASNAMAARAAAEFAAPRSN
jgi:FdrA protein